MITISVVEVPVVHHLQLNPADCITPVILHLKQKSLFPVLIISGKDKIVFMTSEDLMKPSTINFPEEEDEAPGLVLPNGDINWECPCLGGMATGPCGVEFREAFTCFHYRYIFN